MTWKGDRQSSNENLYLSIIEKGLPITTFPKRIVILGAGISGLVTASLLKDAGHDVIIIEASHRVGGRILTIREPFKDGYLEAGPMRIPNSHHLPLAYIKKFNLPLNTFINSTPNDWIYVNGVKTRRSIYEQNPDVLNFPVAPWEKGKTAEELIMLVIKPIIDFIDQDPVKNWPLIINKYDRYSMEFFLRHNPSGGVKLSPGAVEMIKVMESIEGLPELSFLELLREFIIFLHPNLTYYEILGGFDRLPNAFIPQLKDHLCLNEKVVKIKQEVNGVTIYTRNQQSCQTSTFIGDYAIVTIPFSVLQFIDFEPRNSISPGKRRAIRELHYVVSTKIGLEFSQRFWEKDGLFGGQSITDYPIHFSFYPSHYFGPDKGGVMIASYTWEDDTVPWESQLPHDRIALALDNLAKIFGPVVYETFVTGTAYNWGLDPLSGGGFVMFKPEQERELSPYIGSPEGRVHFAGGQSALPHGWLQGAIESGIRVALEMNQLR